MPSLSERRAAQEALHALLRGGITKGAIAERLGVSWRAVHRWSQGVSTPKSRCHLDGLEGLRREACAPVAAE